MQKNVKDKSIDLVFCDPPYGIEGDTLDQHYHRDESKVVGGYIDVPISHYAEFSTAWITEMARVLKPGGSFYIVSGFTGFRHILNALDALGLVVENHLAAKYPFGVSTKKKYVSSHYHVVYGHKRPSTKKTFNTNVYFSDQRDSYNDRLSVQELPRDNKRNEVKNKNQLSESFIEKFILYSSNRGDTILDPFMGGFTTGRVALRYGRKFVGFELNEQAFEIFAPTLDDVKVKDDPVVIHPSAEDLAAREKQREGWRKKRLERKEAKQTTYKELFEDGKGLHSDDKRRS